MSQPQDSANKGFRRENWKNHQPFVFLRAVLYSFPIQLLLLHLQKNFTLLLIWAVLFGIVTGHIGKEFGIPYLFLDPEYLGNVNALSLFIMGLATGGFGLAFQITSYSMESHRFRFLGYLRRPFGKFFLNNSILPLLFVIVYVVNFIKFQTESEALSNTRILTETFAFLAGLTLFILIFFYYLVGTNKDLFVFLGPTLIGSKERRRLRRIRHLGRSKEVLQDSGVSYYLETPWRIKKVNNSLSFNTDTIQEVFAQNHLNAILIEVGLLISILLLGIFADRESMHIPAGASLLLFFTILVMVSGWASYWFKKWTIAITILIFIIFNYMTLIWYRGNQGAAGLDYTHAQASYSMPQIKSLSTDQMAHADMMETRLILDNWRKKFGAGKPKMLLLCVSGGGQRSAIWTIRNLQLADSIAGGNLMKHTVLITGASGGMIGAAYYRELYLRKLIGAPIKLNDRRYEAEIGRDNLNAIMFNFVVNDIFLRSLTFDYLGKSYYRDRGQALEEELNRNTHSMLDKKISDYALPEKEGKIPMMFLSPTIINDGRKLYISPQHISYMNSSDSLWRKDSIRHVQGIEFSRFYAKQKASDLRFLSALRMSATFPYITPNVELPSEPEMEVMDAGMTDNYGIDDALKFAFIFRNWIRDNTSGLVVLSIRDAPSEKIIEKQRKLTLMEKMISTIGSFYGVWEDIQNNYNDAGVSYARSWLGKDLDYVELPYIPDFSGGKRYRDSISLKVVRGASLSWHLTRFEKENIQQSIMRPNNVKAFNRLQTLVGKKDE